MPTQPAPRSPQRASEPIAEIERRIRWRVHPMMVFLGILVALGVVAVLPIVVPPERITGLPDDPEVREAARLLRGRAIVEVGGLRFRSAVLGDAAGEEASPAPGEPAWASAESLLARARARRRDDPRLAAAAASVDLARGRVESAERGFRTALSGGARYGEARLGLGVALALRASRENDPLSHRALTLRSVAQFAEVESGEPAYEAALYNRVRLLWDVGRREESRRLGRAYLALDSTSRWADLLRDRLDMPRP